TASGRGSDLRRGKLQTSTIEQRRSNIYFHSHARWRFTESSRRAPSDIDSQSGRPSEQERTSQTSYEPVSRNIPNSHSVEKCYDLWSVGSDIGRNCHTLARRRGGAKSK